MLAASPASFAVSQTEDEDALYRGDRTNRFNQQQERLNDQGYINDAEAPAVHNLPQNQPISGKASDCVKQGNDQECQKIEINN